MRNLRQLSICLAILMAMAATCVAQGDNRPRQPKPVPPLLMREEVVAIAPVVSIEPGEVSHAGRATVSYYPKTNLTSVEVNLPQVYKLRQATVDLEFNFGFDGRQPSKPSEVHWAFVSDWNVFKEHDSLVVLADGKQFQFAPGLSNGLGGQRIVAMDFASFEQIVNSRSTKVSIGQVAFELNESQREALRDMLRIVGAQSK
jgi:hypothetical protein